LNDPGNFNQFMAGDNFQLSLSSPVKALGLYFITTADPVFAGDISLVTASGTAQNAGVPDLTLADTGTAYFIGIISDSAFSSAQIQFDPAATGAFFYDITTATEIGTPGVPEPATFLICGSALVFLALVRRPHRQRTSAQR
jgi:hypothetical protein